MKENNDSSVIVKTVTCSENEKMNRRGFLVAAGNLLLPTLGLIGLSLAAFPAKAEATCYCSGTCMGDCWAHCQNDCGGSCRGGCEKSCTGSCGSTCRGSCSGGAQA
ncbi:MAG: Cys-Xaa-Xaa-Xaa repeat radical SAM target protein [Negativicutes bacterium]|nr:Cys-Xaa-Xaa-Xaa repeat radical SAM target protein [Negativicutes bacterium]